MALGFSAVVNGGSGSTELTGRGVQSISTQKKSVARHRIQSVRAMMRECGQFDAHQFRGLPNRRSSPNHRPHSVRGSKDPRPQNRQDARRRRRLRKFQIAEVPTDRRRFCSETQHIFRAAKILVRAAATNWSQLEALDRICGCAAGGTACIANALVI